MPCRDLPQRIDGIARAAASQLEVADRKAVQSFHGQPRQRQTHFGVRRKWGELLVRRDGRRDDQDAIESHRLPALLRGKYMTFMRRIEGTAVDSDV